VTLGVLKWNADIIGLRIDLIVVTGRLKNIPFHAVTGSLRVAPSLSKLLKTKRNKPTTKTQ